MKIACISTSRIPSETANSIQVMKVCQGLARNGHIIHLFIPETEHADWPALAERYALSEQFAITWLPADPRLKHNDFAWTAVQQAHVWGAAMVYTWAAPAAVIGLLRGLPAAFEVHDLPTGKLGPWWFRALLRLPGKKRLLPITRALLRRLQGLYGRFPADQVVIVPNGVDLEQYQALPSAPEARRMLGLAEQITVSCSGHLYAGRGVDLFLNLARRFPRASFVWVGGRPEDVTAYRQKVQESRLANVTFTGFVSQRALPCYQAASDVLLMPYARSIAGSSGGNSVDICSPMKMFDYLAAGRAIVSSDLPVIHEILSEANAVYAPPEDLEGWSSVLGRLLADNELRRKLSEQARRDAERYTWRDRARRALDGFIE